MRVVAIDTGEVRVGIAVSDEERSFAFPKTTVEAGVNAEQTAKAIEAALADVAIAEFVVGLPLRLDGSEGEAARKARLLGDAIAARFDVAVHYWDERLSSAAAERSLRSIGVRGRRHREVVDQSAAAVFLQSYLDARARDGS